MAAIAFKRVAFAGVDLYLRVAGYAIEADSKTMYDALVGFVYDRILASRRLAVGEG